MTAPCLLPRPLRYEETGGRFAPDDGLSIVVSHAAEPGEWVVARQVQEAARRLYGAVPIQPQRQCPDARDTVVLAVRGRDESIFPAEAQLPSLDGIPASPEAYTLTVSEEGIAVWGQTPAGLARGAQTLCQLLSGAGDDGAIPALAIADAPALPWRGIMLDVSRGKLPTLETLKGLVDVVASFKLNMLQLYVEHTFASRRHPEIGREWGALTPEEIVALDAYCRERYVELVPCLQSFGHLRRILELPAYRHLAESEALWSLTPVQEESYKLLGDLYADFLACFTSPYINVCSDETFDLGIGQSREVAEREGRGRLFLRHIQRLHELAAAHGRTIMVWDDMFLHYPELLAELPPDTILLNWWYEEMDHYRQIDVVHDTGLRQIVCPGTSTWNTLFPRVANARGNIRAMIAQGQQVGAMGMLLTDWGDNGHPNLLGNSWYGYAFGGCEAWTPGQVSDEEFERCFTRLFFGPQNEESVLAAIHDLNEACLLPGLEIGNGTRSISMFFGDPLIPPPVELTPQQIEFLVEMLRVHGVETSAEAISRSADAYNAPIPAETPVRMRELATDALNRLASVQPVSPQAAITLDEFRLAACQIRHAAEKAQVGQEVMNTPDGVADLDLTHRLLLLKRELHELRHEYERIWLERNKPQGLWLTLDQLDVAAQVLDRWLARVQPRYGWGQ